MMSAVVTATELSGSATFWYGAMGAVFSLLFVQVLPFAFEVVSGKTTPSVSAARLIAAFVILVIFILGGGVAATLAGDASEARHAIAYGLGWQAAIGGIIQGARVALR